MYISVCHARVYFSLYIFLNRPSLRRSTSHQGVAIHPVYSDITANAPNHWLLAGRTPPLAVSAFSVSLVHNKGSWGFTDPLNGDFVCVTIELATWLAVCHVTREQANNQGTGKSTIKTFTPCEDARNQYNINTIININVLASHYYHYFYANNCFIGAQTFRAKTPSSRPYSLYSTLRYSPCTWF